MKLLVDKAFVPAGGSFIFLPLVDKASVTAGGPLIFRLTLLNVTADVSLQALLHLSFFVTADVLDRGGQRASYSFFFRCVRPVNLCMTTRNATV